MIREENRMEFAVLAKHGMRIRGITESTGLSRNTVRRDLRGGDGVTPRKLAPKRPEKLDPFKDYIVDRLKADAPDVIPAAVLFRESRRAVTKAVGPASGTSCAACNRNQS